MTQGTMELDEVMERVQTVNGPAPDEAPGAIMRKAMCLSLELRRLGNTRRVNSGAIQTDADRSWVRVNKSLLESKELDAIARADNELRRYIQSRCLPSMFKSGIYLVPNALVIEVDDYIEKFMAERAVLVETFVQAYVERREDARLKLGTLYNPADYESDIEDVRAAFGVRRQYIAFDTPGTLRDIKRELFEREAASAAAYWTDAKAECRQVLRLELQSLLDHAAERLAPGADGKPKIFRDSLIKNLDDFFSTFNARNTIGEDAEIEDIVAEARSIMAGVEPNELRKRDDYRAATASRLNAIKAKLDAIVKPTTRGFASIEE